MRRAVPGLGRCAALRWLGGSVWGVLKSGLLLLPTQRGALFILGHIQMQPGLLEYAKMIMIGQARRPYCRAGRWGGSGRGYWRSFSRCWFDIVSSIPGQAALLPSGKGTPSSRSLEKALAKSAKNFSSSFL